jgi:ferredoxin-NADP reductase/MOSC domain-containing protein YiiM/ferredoxin
VPSLVSVNVGIPRDIAWQGRIVHTAVWKQPVTSRVMARRLNLDGDGQGDLAGHGGEHRAVMVYQLESYRYWQTFLQRDDFEYGQFGENLTVDGLPDHEVCIGDRYRIGGALFEVTQPRVTCYRVGIRMNNPTMPALLVAHKRPGFYFRVIEEGEIGIGDEIVKIADGPQRVTVEEVDGLLYLPNHAPDRLQRALQVPALSAGWRESLSALAAAVNNPAQSGNAGLAPSSAPSPYWRGFRALRVAEIHPECVDVLSFVLESEDHGPLPPALPGQFLVFKLQLANDAEPLLRSYSLSGPQNTGNYRISVKRGLGVGSQYFHDRIQIGDMLQVSAPRGSFTLPDGDRPVVFGSAGIGATPVLAMLHAVADSAPRSTREVWWCYGARNGSEHPFAAEARGLLKDLPQHHSLVVYSRPEMADQQGRDYDLAGHLSVALLQQLQVPKEADFFLCGPPAFLSLFTADLTSWSVPDSSIHSEIFGAGPSLTPGIAAAESVAPHPPAHGTGVGPRVSFTRSNLTVPWDAQYESLLQFAEACDIPVKWSCRRGVCHTCESGLIDGTVTYSFEPLDRPREGNILICCSTPQTAIDLDL